MIKCILCNQVKESSVEHIIPKSLGNKSLTTNLVCKKCNSKMGEKVDGPFINNPLIDMLRNSLNLSGYTGKVPNPFSKGIDTKGNKIYLDNDFKPKLLPNVIDNDDGFSISAGSKEEAYEIGLRKLKRLGATDEDINNFLKELESTEVKVVQPKINYEFDINFKDIEIGFLKIAYELMYLLAGEEYYNDDISTKIRYILNQFMNNKVTDYKFLITPNSLNRIDVRKTLKHLGNIHMIIPTLTSSNQLIISIFLFSGELSYDVLVSENGQEFPKLKLTPVIIKIEN